MPKASLPRGLLSLLLPVLILSAIVSIPSRAQDRPTQIPAAGLVIHTMLAAVDSARITAWVLVENTGYGSVDVPGDLNQYITEAFQLGDNGTCHVFRSVYCPGDRGVVELLLGHCLGRRVSVRRPPTATAVRFEVDLGGALGVLRSDWVPLPR